MKIYEKRWEQRIAADLDTVWEFFSRPENLNRITPDELSFEIRTDIANVPMYAGMVIEYKVRPLFNIPMQWVTEITHMQPGVYFVDEQRYGPYALWHHQHHFSEVGNYVHITDILHYAIGWGVLGRLVHQMLIEKKVNEIFTYRTKAVKQIFEKC